MSLIRRASIYLGMPEGDLIRIARSAPHRYKVFKIDKRSGNGERTIAQPAKEVKAIQRWLARNELGELPIHPAAMAYVCDRGIKLNAEQHKDSKYLLKVDFSNFFPSIHPLDLENHIHKYSNGKYSEAEINFICRICFWYRIKSEGLELCIGGPSSPFLSNTIMYDFDVLLADYCIANKITYTRYADDLTLSSSTPNVLSAALEYIRSILRLLESPILSVNENKTVYTSKKYRRFVTGLVLTNDGVVSLGRERKRLIRAMIYRFEAGLLDPTESEKLRGLLAFAHDAEPNFILRMRSKYSNKTIDSILRFVKERKTQ